MKQKGGHQGSDDDTFRLDLTDKDEDYIREVLDTFRDDAHRYRRKLIEIRMTKPMAMKLGIAESSPSYRDVPVVVANTGFEDTIEVLLGPLQ